MRYKGSKPESSVGSLWKVQTENAKTSYFIKNLSPLKFLRNLQIFTVYYLLILKLFECRKCFYFEKKSTFKEIFFRIWVIKSLFIFNSFLKSLFKLFKEYFFKVWYPSLKNVGEDKFLVFFLSFWENWDEKIAVHTFI